MKNIGIAKKEGSLDMTREPEKRVIEIEKYFSMTGIRGGQIAISGRFSGSPSGRCGRPGKTAIMVTERRYECWIVSRGGNIFGSFQKRYLRLAVATLAIPR